LSIRSLRAEYASLGESATKVGRIKNPIIALADSKRSHCSVTRRTAPAAFDGRADNVTHQVVFVPVAPRAK
jgi:hypothetical protein